MKKYRVFQDGVRCKDHNIPGWDVDTFDSHEEASVFAYKWCYGGLGFTDYMCVEKARIEPIPLDDEVDLSWCEIPLMMKILIVEE